MPDQVQFRVQTREFDSALKAYMTVSTRSLSDVVNKKAFFVTRRAARETPVTSKQAIVSSLGRITRRRGQFKTKLVSAGAVYSHLQGSQAAAPLAALIINARKGRTGEPGVEGPRMAAAIAALIGARNRSRAFLKSGWLPAIRRLDAVVHDRRGDPGSDFGLTGRVSSTILQGGAKPATAGFQVKCTIENAASGKHETQHALYRYGGPALQRAFTFETASTLAEVARRQYEEAKKIGIKAVGSF